MDKRFSYIPFIENMNKNQIGCEPEFKKISENGKYDTLATSTVFVNVEGSGGGSGDLDELMQETF